MATGIFALIIGIGCIWFSFKFIRTYMDVRKWTRTEAIVLHKSVKMHEKYSTGRSKYAVLVDYSYVYDSVDYKNNMVYLAELMGGQANHLESAANRIIAGLPGKIQIYVNPKNPKQSVIYCNGLLLYTIVLITGFVALLIALSNFLK